MTENKENWLYPDASGLYFVHDGFIMRATDGKQYDIEEECDLLNELSDKNRQLEKENEQLDCYKINELSEEVKRLKCINKQLEERLGRSLALDMEECG